MHLYDVAALRQNFLKDTYEDNNNNGDNNNEESNKRFLSEIREARQ